MHFAEQLESLDASAAGRPSPPSSHASTAEPNPYQPGSIRRHWAQENTQGIARKVSIARDLLRDAGRLPMFSSAISLITVDSQK